MQWFAKIFTLNCDLVLGQLMIPRYEHHLVSTIMKILMRGEYVFLLHENQCNSNCWTQRNETRFLFASATRQVNHKFTMKWITSVLYFEICHSCTWLQWRPAVVPSCWSGRRFVSTCHGNKIFHLFAITVHQDHWVRDDSSVHLHWDSYLSCVTKNCDGDASLTNERWPYHGGLNHVTWGKMSAG
jgi:hypothetical protein